MSKLVLPIRASRLQVLVNTAHRHWLGQHRLLGPAEFCEMIQREREHQDRKHGTSNNSGLTLDRWCNILTEELGEFVKECLDISKGDSKDLEVAVAELIHVAAVAQLIYEYHFVPLLGDTDEGSDAA